LYYYIVLIQSVSLRGIMRKKVLFTIYLILIAILFMTVAFTCSFCDFLVGKEGAEQAEIDTVEQDDNESSPAGNSSSDSSNADQEESAEDSSQASSNDNDDQSDNASENNPPQITRIIYSGQDIIGGSGSLSVSYQQGLHEFEITAKEPEGENIDLKVSAGLGTITEIVILEPGIFRFIWSVPEAPSGAVDPIGTALDLIVLDVNGNRTTYRIEIILTPPEQEDQIFEPVEEASIGSIILKASNELSGMVIEDDQAYTGTIFIGDDPQNRVLKGYISFDISDLTSVEADSISKVNLRFDSVRSINVPFHISNTVIFKVFYYGNSLDLQDYYDNGVVFATTDAMNFGGTNKIINSGHLGTRLKLAIEENKQWFQISIRLDGNSNNDDGYDTFQIKPKDVYLDIDFD